MILLIPHIIKDNTELTSITDSQRDSFIKASKEVKPIDVQKEISGK